MAATAYFNKFPSYCRMVAHAKSLANRSVLIDHCGLEHIDLLTELNNVEHVYSIEKETRRGFSKLSLIEFKSDKDAEQVTEQAHHNDGLLPVPLKILRYNARMSSLQSAPQSNYPFQIDRVRLCLDKESSPSFTSYTELMSNNMMSLVALKLRFVTLVNFERILCSGMFEMYELMPFGSSVIDTGCDSGDLDLIFTRKVDHYNAIINGNQTVVHDKQRQRDQHEHGPELGSPISSPSSAISSRLIHLDKSLYSETKDNSGFRGTMRWFDHMLREYMPLTDGFGVLTLHRAKVPIIKFTSRITNIDCDLSFDLGLDQREYDINSIPVNHGILMTEILYSLCRNNNLITALVIYLRIFAKVTAITSKVPGVGMTNFQFLSTVIFFLQQITVQRHASHDQKTDDDSLISNMDSHDRAFTIRYVQPKEQAALIPPFRDLVNGNFLLNPKEPIHYDDNELNQILPSLIKRYFEFYSSFDFARHSLNLYESRRDKKLDNSTIFVLNPIDKTRNICHNVNRKGVETLVNQVRSASSTMRASRGACPLSMLRAMMIKHQKQVKKNRSLGLQIDDMNDAQAFSPEGIFQDACR